MSPAGHVFLWLLIFCVVYEIAAFIRNHYHLQPVSVVTLVAFCTGWGIFALAAVLWWLTDRLTHK